MEASAAISRAALLLAALAAGCDQPAPTEVPPSWQVVFEHLPGAVLRVIGTKHDDVTIVGADPDGQGPLVMHFDGARWKKLHPGVTGDLWWSFPVGPEEVRMVGDDGQIVRFNPKTETFSAGSAPTHERLFGVWSSSPNDVWMVGGATARNRGVMWHDEGSGPSAPTHLPTVTSSAALFKAQGFSANAVWFVGQAGTLIRYDGAQFETFPAITHYPLMGLHGSAPDRVYAVGGVAGGVILAFDGTSWKDESPKDLPQMIAVWAVDADEAYAAGFNGSLYHRKDGAWTKVTPRLPTFVDLHSIWVDEKGGIWLAGGRLALDPPTDGVLLYYGPPLSKEVIE